MLRKSCLLISLIALLFWGISVYIKAEVEQLPNPTNSKLSLNGIWKFAIDIDDEGENIGYQNSEFSTQNWRDINVPSPWEKQGVKQKNPNFMDDPIPYGGIGWYCRQIDIPKDWEGFDLKIYLGTIDDAGKAWFNGNYIGESNNVEESTLFNIDKKFIKYGFGNKIAVKVKDIGQSGGITGGDLTIAPITLWDKIAFNFETYKYNVFYKDEDVIFKLSAVSQADKPIEANLKCKIYDIDKKNIYDKTFAYSLKNKIDKENTIEVNLNKLQTGWYEVEISLEVNGKIVASSPSSFVVFPEEIKFENPENSPFGLCGGSLFHISLEEHKTLGERRLAMHKMVGAIYGRNDIWWGSIEKPKGTWDFAKADSTVNLFTKNGIDLLGILCYFSDWAPDHNAPKSEADRDEFANYVKTMVTRYKDKIKNWEIWNEPNINIFWSPKPDPNNYTELLKKSYTEIKKIDTNIKVVGMVTSGVDIDFIEKCLKLDAGKYMDVISVHPYQHEPPGVFYPRTSMYKIFELKNMLTKYNVNIPIWLTECGWQTINLSLKQQSEYVVKFYVSLLSKKIVERIYWFNLDDWQPRETTSAGQFGLLFNNQTPKPSYLAYYTMTKFLHDFVEINNNINIPSTVFCVKFIFNKRNPVYVLWSEKGEHEIQFPQDVNKQYDIFGKEIIQLSNKIKITGSPCYLTNF